MTRPSNRELKVLSHLGEVNALGPDDFKDVGDKVFSGMLKKNWIVADSKTPGVYRATEKGLTVHAEEIVYKGRWKR
ncbi:hypothetical protein GCM10007989_05740 [Devosia pacifica]|uniref:Uncharacterized protein n=1 Tax=Devosia pacifica TaxID=1335967 RepID=A0A918RYT8_9HYPH|nr:hypothetical protein [Devosia pacifica]GHA13941.1 hypothetical protein GCM10007989_05740 [Devosia pacifica]